MERQSDPLCARVDARSSARPSDRIGLTCDPARFHYFDPASVGDRSPELGRRPCSSLISTRRGTSEAIHPQLPPLANGGAVGESG